MENELMGYVYTIMQNGASDYFKNIIGKNFDKLANHCFNDEKEKFEDTLCIILNANEEIKNKLEALKNGDTTNQYNKSGNNYNGIGNLTTNTTNNYVENKKNTINIMKHPLYKRYVELYKIKNMHSEEFSKKAEEFIQLINERERGDFYSGKSRASIYRVSSTAWWDIDDETRKKEHISDRNWLDENKPEVEKLLKELLESL